MRLVTTQMSRLREFGSFQNALCFVDQGIVSVISFIGAALVGRICGDAELGIYGMAITTFWLLAGVPNSLIWTPYVSKAPHMVANRRLRYENNLAIHVGLLSIVIAAILFVTERVAYFQGLSPDWFTRTTWGLIPFFVLMTMREHVRRLHLSRIDGEGLLKLDVPIAVGQVCLLVFITQTGRVDSFNVLMAMSLPCAFAFFELGSRLLRKVHWKRLLLHWNFNFGLGRTLLVVTILTLLGDLFLRFVLGNLHSVQALGRLAAVLVTVTFFNPIQLTVQSLTRAKVAMSFVGGDRNSIIEQTRSSLVLTAKYMGLLYLLLGVFGGPLAEILFWRKFSDIQGNILSLSVAAYLQTLSFPAEAALTSLRQGKSILNSSLLRCLVLTILGVPLIYSFEIVGFGVAVSISYAASIAYQWLQLNRVCANATQARI